MPHYIVKLPDEAAWAAWLTALGGVTALICNHFGLDAGATTVVTTFVTVTGRLITGMLLPTSTRKEAVESAVANTKPASEET